MAIMPNEKKNIEEDCALNEYVTVGDIKRLINEFNSKYWSAEDENPQFSLLAFVYKQGWENRNVL